MVTLTKPQALMLAVLREACDQRRPDGRAFEYAAPRQLAKMRWPDSPGWRKVSSRGSTPAGGAMGATMPMKAATVLWRLQGKGLALCEDYNRWTITDKGRRWLTEQEQS